MRRFCRSVSLNAFVHAARASAWSKAWARRRPTDGQQLAVAGIGVGSGGAYRSTSAR